MAKPALLLVSVNCVADLDPTIRTFVIFQYKPASSILDVVGTAVCRRRDENGWVQEAEITASDGEVQSSFGNSVAMLSLPGRDNIALIGAWKDSELHDRSGAAYVYETKGGGVWNETIKLMPEELIRKSYFGNSVAIQEGKSGDILEIFAGAGPLDTVYSFELCIK